MGKPTLICFDFREVKPIEGVSHPPAKSKLQVNLRPKSQSARFRTGTLREFSACCLPYTSLRPATPDTAPALRSAEFARELR